MLNARFNKLAWATAFRSAGLEYTEGLDEMHALRHFYASALLARGVSIKELAGARRGRAAA
ncbi:hypothetical protein GCM10025787_43300 [Saccharopolyspora rosea]